MLLQIAILSDQNIIYIRNEYMKAVHVSSHQHMQWIHTQWWKRRFDIQTRLALLAKLHQKYGTKKASSEALGQFVRFCVVWTSNAIIDFGVLNLALAAFPTR